MFSNYVRIASTSAALIFLAGFLASAPAYGEEDARLLEKLGEKVTWAPGPIKLRTFLEDLTQQHQINIMVDSRTVPDPLVIDSPGFEQLPLQDALAQLLQGAGLAFGMQEGFLWISTPDRLRHESFDELETRVYYVEQREVPDVNRNIESEPRAEILIDDLASRIIPIIVNPSGEPLSFLKYIEESKQLIVHNTPANHSRMEQLLELLKS